MTPALQPRHARILRAVCIAVLCLVAILVYREYFIKTPVQEIEALLADAAQAAEAQSILRLGNVFSVNYADSSGADRSMILAQAQRFFGEVENLSVRLAHIQHEDPDLPPSASEARAIVVLRISGTETTGGQRFQGVLGDGADTFLVTFARIRDDWRIAATRRLDTTSPEAMLEALN